MAVVTLESLPTTSQRAYRTSSVDLLRGLVIIVMALDHVRDSMMQGAIQDPTTDPHAGPLLFATRWITHFCAPTFVFLAGVGAGLSAERRTRSELGRFLLLRGLWLIAVEVFVISTATTFAPAGLTEFGGRTFIGLQVFWAIGASMIALAAAQYLGRRACFALGLAIVFGHNLLDAFWPAAGSGAPLWAVLHSRQAYDVGGFHFNFAYPVLPWIGVMFAGYGGAWVFQLPDAQRSRLLRSAGLCLIAVFVSMRLLASYGDPRAWDVRPSAVATVMSFVNVTKYPPSLLYVLVTLGPALLVCAYIDRWPVHAKTILSTFGRAPFAFYVAHLVLIHMLSIGLGVFEGFLPSQMLTHYSFFPSGYGLNLVGVYVAWIAVVAALYPLSRHVVELKARRSDWWLSYV